MLQSLSSNLGELYMYLFDGDDVLDDFFGVVDEFLA